LDVVNAEPLVFGYVVDSVRVVVPSRQLNRLSNVGVMDQLEHRAAGALAQPGQSIVKVRVSIRLGGGRSLPELSPKVYVSLNGRDHHLAA
jgi:hypothetical protein